MAAKTVAYSGGSAFQFRLDGVHFFLVLLERAQAT